MKINRGNIDLIPNGVDLQRFHPRLRSEKKRRELGLSVYGPVVGTVGRAVSEKGQVYLIEAVAKLKNRFPDLSCLIIGEGPLTPSLKKRANNLGIRDMCIFGGVHEDIEEIYPLVDVFVLPSVREPFGLVLLEAMATGVPVIATESGGPVDFIRSGINGLLVSPNDSEKLASAIGILLKNPEKRTRMGREGQKTVLQNYSVEKMVRRIESVYHHL